MDGEGIPTLPSPEENHGWRGFSLPLSGWGGEGAVLKEIEEYTDRSHFDSPQRAEAERLARALQQLWLRSETVAPVYAKLEGR
jgi:hypothetical protein